MPPTPPAPVPPSNGIPSTKPSSSSSQVTGSVRFSPSAAKALAATKPKIGASTVSVFVIFLLVILLIIAAAAVGVAKTGLVHIPFASRFYEGPMPTRMINVTPVEPQVFLQRVSDKVNAVIQQGGMPPYRITFDERELTGALQGAIQSAMRDSDVTIDHMQLAVTPPHLELYGRIHNKTVTITTLVQLVPKIQNGELMLDPVRVQVGDYAIPTSTARELSGSLFSRDFGAWKLNAGEMTLEDIRVVNNALELTLSMKR